jgi:hypothetical protein
VIAISPPETAAPIPTSPNWPSEICPPQPVSTTRLTATIPYSGSSVSRGRFGSPTSNGATTAISTVVPSRPYRHARTSGRSRSSVGIGRNTFTDWKELTPESFARDSVPALQRAARPG